MHPVEGNDIFHIAVRAKCFISYEEDEETSDGKLLKDDVDFPRAAEVFDHGRQEKQPYSRRQGQHGDACGHDFGCFSLMQLGAPKQNIR